MRKYFYESNKDISLLQQALNKMIERQSALRLRFVEENGVPMQYMQEFSENEFPIRKFENSQDYEQYVSSFAKILLV